MKKYLLFFIFLSTSLFANESTHNNYDIVERLINFVIFCGILYYFLAKPLTKMYKDRIASISNSLESAQKRLQETKSKREISLKKIEEAKLSAENIIKMAHKEAELTCNKLRQDMSFEILNIEKSFQEQKDYEKRKMIKEVVADSLKNIFDSNELNIDEKELVNIITKKVAS